MSNIIQEQKFTVKNLKNHMELKTDEISNFKKEYEKLLIAKEKKINELQEVLNQTYTRGKTNMKLNNQINDEMKGIVLKMKVDEKDFDFKDHLSKDFKDFKEFQEPIKNINKKHK